MSSNYSGFIKPYLIGHFLVTPIDTAVAMKASQQCVFNATPMTSIFHKAGVISGLKYVGTCATKDWVSTKSNDPIINGAIVGTVNHIMSMVTDVLIKQAADPTFKGCLSIHANSHMKAARVSFLCRDVWLFCWVLNSNHLINQCNKNYEEPLRGLSIVLGGITSAIPHVAGISFMNRSTQKQVINTLKNPQYIRPIVGIRIFRTALIDWLMKKD